MKGMRAALVATVAVIVGLWFTVRRWAATPDVSGGPLAGPTGTTRTLARPDGVTLQVYEAGPQDGPLYVLAHCWVGDARVWGPVAQRLVDAGARVVRYDHRGHGQSTLTDAMFTLDALGDDLAAVIESLPPRSLVLAGHSMGGMAAQALLQRHPELVQQRVAGLALVATAADGQSPGPRRSAVRSALVRDARSNRFIATPVVGTVVMRTIVGRQVCKAHLDAQTQLYLATPTHARADLLESIHAMDFVPTLAREARMPTAIVVGAWDVLTPPSVSKRMAAAVPDADLIVLPHAGHMLPWERPDEVAKILLDLGGLDRHDPLRMPVQLIELEQAL